MGTSLTKTQRLYGYTSREDNTVTYTYYEETYYEDILTITKRDWEDMGRPDTILVTIVPNGVID